MNSKVDIYFNNLKKWKEELDKLRVIILNCQLIEELKWNIPCYMFQKSNIIFLNSFKEYCTITFFKGALLNDVNSILIQQTINTQAARQIRFTNIKQIVDVEPILKTYIYEAIKVEKSGLKVDFKKSIELTLSKEFQDKLNKDTIFKNAFYALTPGRRRAYNLYFSAPKQSKTRALRIEKYTQQIINGNGINDCTCGLSKKIPYCDGSHKNI